MNENYEEWKLESRGAMFVITREVIINDSMSAFANLMSRFAVMSRNTQNSLSYQMLTQTGKYANYKMTDGTLVYSQSHANTTTDVFSSSALSSAKLAMSKHKSTDGESLNITPKFLIVGAALG